MHPVDHRKIELVTSGHRHFVRFDDIYCVEASGSYSTFHLTHGRRITVSKNLKRIEAQLCERSFCRVHNSHLVRLTSVSSMNYRKNTLSLDSGQEVKISTRKRDEVRRRLDAMLVLDAKPLPLSIAADVPQEHGELS
jgi:two-component system LytT family response regulator